MVPKVFEPSKFDCNCFLVSDNEADDDIENVSVGGMDVSDIDDDEDHIPKPSRGQPKRGPSQPSSGPPTQRSGAASGPKPSFQPRYQPRPPAQTQYTHAMVSSSE